MTILAKCIEEEKSGNSEFVRAKKHLHAALKEYKLPEVDYFLDNFMEAFTFSIDEMDEIK